MEPSAFLRGGARSRKICCPRCSSGSAQSLSCRAPPTFVTGHRRAECTLGCALPAASLPFRSVVELRRRATTFCQHTGWSEAGSRGRRAPPAHGVERGWSDGHVVERGGGPKRDTWRRLGERQACLGRTSLPSTVGRSFCSRFSDRFYFSHFSQFFLSFFDSRKKIQEESLKKDRKF